MDKKRLSTVSAIALNAIFGNDPKFSHNIIDALGSCEAVFSLSAKELDEVFGPYSKFKESICEASLEAADREYDTLSAQGFQFLDIFDEGYPQLLRECPDAPVLLYVRSSAPAASLFNGRPAVSIVGTRDISLYGKEWCTRIVQAISEAPVKPLIVSGLAIGVDITAHLAALGCGLPTVGVSPVGIDDIYPARHRVAAEKMVSSEGGAVVTDYPPGTQPLPFNFLRRNRIIAGLSSSTILVESKVRGGGMMTARLASGYGRNVFVLPGRIDDLRSGGCNALLEQKLAEPIVSLGSLTEALGLGKYSLRKRSSLEAAVRGRFSDKMPEKDVESLVRMASEIKGERGIDFEGLCRKMSMDYPAVAGLAGLLESEGFIETDLLSRCVINAKNA